MFIDSNEFPPGSIVDFANWLIAFVDDTNILIVALVAAFLRHVAMQLRAPLPWKDAARYGSCLFLFAYILHLSDTVDFRSDLAGVLTVLIRASLVAYLFYLCIAAPTTFVAHLATRFCQAEIHRLQSFSRELSERHQRNKQEVAYVPPPQPVPRQDQLKNDSFQARVDYEFECQVLRAAGLGEDELETGLVQAKQKYLKRLQEALQ